MFVFQASWFEGVCWCCDVCISGELVRGRVLMLWCLYFRRAGSRAWSSVSRQTRWRRWSTRSCVRRSTVWWSWTRTTTWPASSPCRTSSTTSSLNPWAKVCAGAFSLQNTLFIVAGGVLDSSIRISCLPIQGVNSTPAQTHIFEIIWSANHFCSLTSGIVRFWQKFKHLLVLVIALVS